MRYIAVEREELRAAALRRRAAQRPAALGVHRRREALQRRDGIGVEIIGPRSSAGDAAMVEFVRRNRLPYTLARPRRRRRRTRGAGRRARRRRAPARAAAGRHGAARRRAAARCRARSASGSSSTPREEVDLLVVGGGPAGLGAAVYGASEGLDTLVDREHRARRPGRHLAADRELPRLPGRHQRLGADQPRRHPGAQVRRADGDAVPRASRSSPATTATSCGSRAGARSRARAVVLATGAEYRRLPVADLEDYEGISVFYAAGPPEAQRCGATRVGVVGGGNSAGAGRDLARARRRARDAAAPPRRPARDDVRLPDRRPRALRRRGARPQRDRRAARQRRPARGGHAARRRAAAALVPVPVPRRRAVHGLARRHRRARRRRASSSPAPTPGADGLLETSVPGVFAAGDVRSGSIKRCATAVGEGAMVVRFVHERLRRVPAQAPAAAR